MPRNKAMAGIVVAVLFLALLAGAWYLTRGGAAPAPTSTSTGKATSTGEATATQPTRGATKVTSTTKATGNDPESGLPWVAPAELPSQARDTIALIDAGGPYPYPGKDGSTYRNLNGVLPKKADGYYKEYTVKTPGESDRGARRIVVGKGGEFYYTGDHYDSFSRIQR